MLKIDYRTFHSVFLDFTGIWTLSNLTFGVPLFDSELNKSICQKIVINSLWKSDSLANLAKSGESLVTSINKFILEHQDIPLNDANDKIWMTPEERKKSPVPLPTRTLFFDGQHLHDSW